MAFENKNKVVVDKLNPEVKVDKVNPKVEVSTKIDTKTPAHPISVAEDIVVDSDVAAEEQAENAEGTGHYIEGQNKAQQKAAEGDAE